MIGKYKIITLCGSIKFQEDFLKEQKRLTVEGNIVLIPNFFGSEDKEVLTYEVLAMLKDMHFRKIDMADEIFVINKGGYIGASTKLEIEYAKQIGKIVKYMEI